MTDEDDMWAPRKRDADGKLLPPPPPKNEFVRILVGCMKQTEEEVRRFDGLWMGAIADWHSSTLVTLMDAAPEAYEEQWVWREEFIKALCACKHAPQSAWGGRYWFKQHVIGLRDLHKQWRTKAWTMSQFSRILLCQTAYRDQLPCEFRLHEPATDPFNVGRFIGQSECAVHHPRLANGGDDYLTWRGDYRPFHDPEHAKRKAAA